jgi:hypothetical protein
MAVYIDDVLIQNKALGAAQSVSPASSHFAIGYDPASVSQYWIGEMFDVRVFNVALTSTDVAAIFASPFNPGGGATFNPAWASRSSLAIGGAP